jgi:hypothetical protein
MRNEPMSPPLYHDIRPVSRQWKSADFCARASRVRHGIDGQVNQFLEPAAIGGREIEAKLDLVHRAQAGNGQEHGATVIGNFDRGYRQLIVAFGARVFD